MNGNMSIAQQRAGVFNPSNINYGVREIAHYEGAQRLDPYAEVNRSTMGAATTWHNPLKGGTGGTFLNWGDKAGTTPPPPMGR